MAMHDFFGVLAIIGASTVPIITSGQTASQQTGKIGFAGQTGLRLFFGDQSDQKIHEIVARAAKFRALQKSPLTPEQRDNFRMQIDSIVAEEHDCEGPTYLTPQPHQN